MREGRESNREGAEEVPWTENSNDGNGGKEQGSSIKGTESKAGITVSWKGRKEGKRQKADNKDENESRETMVGKMGWIYDKIEGMDRSMGKTWAGKEDMAGS